MVETQQQPISATLQEKKKKKKERRKNTQHSIVRVSTPADTLASPASAARPYGAHAPAPASQSASHSAMGEGEGITYEGQAAVPAGHDLGLVHVDKDPRVAVGAAA